MALKFVVSASTRTSDGAALSAQYIVNHNLAPVMAAARRGLAVGLLLEYIFGLPGWVNPPTEPFRKISIKEFPMFQRHGLGGLFAVLLGLLSTNAARADEILVTNLTTNTVGKYTTSGATVNAALISGLSGPEGIAVSGSDLFVTNFATGTIGKYTTSGATVNASLVSGLSGPAGITVSGSDLFVV